MAKHKTQKDYDRCITTGSAWRVKRVYSIMSTPNAAKKHTCINSQFQRHIEKQSMVFMEKINKFLMLYLLSPATLALASYSMLVFLKPTFCT